MTIQRNLFLIFSLIVTVMASAQDAANPVDIYADKEHNFFVQVYEEKELYSGNCVSPIIYKIRTTGVSPSNLLLSWTFTFYDCKEKKRQPSFRLHIEKGKGITRQTAFRMSKMKTIVDGTASAVTVRIPENFRITGDTLVLEDDPLNLSVTDILPADTKNRNTKWHWQGSDGTKADGASVTFNPVKTTTYSVRAEQDSFFSVPKKFIVRVKLKPEPPKDFIVENPGTIKEGDEVRLKIKTGSPSPGVKWLWFRNEKDLPFRTGESLLVSPSVTTTYFLQADLNGKKSLFRPVTVNVTPVPDPPSGFSISKTATIREGQRLTLRVISKPTAAGIQWQWLSSDGEKVLETGDSMTVSPSETTTYQLVAISYKKRSAPVRTTVTVLSRSRAPEISGKMKLCDDRDGTESYTINGGRLGTGSARWQWFEGSCGAGRLIGEGNSIKIRQPEKTTTYFVRPDGDATVCREFTIQVDKAAVLPESIMGPVTACPGEQFTLSAKGGKLQNGMQWEWYAQQEGSSAVSGLGEGNQVITDSRVTTTYFVRAEGGTCEPSSAVTTVVHIHAIPSYNGSILPTPLNEKWYRLTAAGAPNGNIYTINWYLDNCGKTKIGTGNSIEYKGSKKGRLIYMQPEGPCDTLQCRSVTIFSRRRATEKYGFLNLGLVGQDFTSYKNGMITVGSKHIYVRAKFNIDKILYKLGIDKQRIDVRYISNDTAIFNFPAGSSSFYEFGNLTKNRRTSYTLGAMMGTTGFRFYLGAGYGKKEYLQQLNIFERNLGQFRETVWAKNKIESIEGIEGEAGLFIKIGGFSLMGGVSVIYSTTDKKYYTDAHAGIGFCFGRRK